MHWNLWTSLDSPSLVLALVLRITCWPILVSTAEVLARPEILDDLGLMSWETGRLRHPLLLVGWTGRVSDWLLNRTSFQRLLWLRALLAATLLVAPASWLLQPAAVGAMTFFLFLWSNRSIYGQDGADQMQLILWLAAWIAILLRGERAAVLCLWFIAYQACMSYCVAGFAKIRASGWRQGRFLPGVLGTTIYGNRRVGAFLRHHSSITLAGSWAVLLFETGFPLAWLLPWPWGLAFLAAGCLFHVANAFLMGLGSFLFTFVAAYPAVWFTLQRKGW
jgi:hypothetical protein